MVCVICSRNARVSLWHLQGRSATILCCTARIPHHLAMLQCEQTSRSLTLTWLWAASTARPMTTATPRATCMSLTSLPPPRKRLFASSSSAAGILISLLISANIKIPTPSETIFLALLIRLACTSDQSRSVSAVQSQPDTVCTTRRRLLAS